MVDVAPTTECDSTSIEQHKAGIRDLVEDARLLWNHGRKFGAFVLVLVCVAGTARKRYPRKAGFSDNASFKRFVLDEMATITGGPKYNVAFPFQGQDVCPLEDILYEQLRCHVLHEGSMPGSIYFTQTIYEDGKSLSVLKLTDPLGFPEQWVSNMVVAVCLAPENKESFGLPFP